MERPSWDQYFMEMAVLTSRRSTCMRRQVGAVIVKDKHIIATGYNGAPRRIAHCEERGGCIRQKLGIPSGERHELCRALHAEQNAIIQAATLAQKHRGWYDLCNSSALRYLRQNDNQCGHQPNSRKGRLS